MEILDVVILATWITMWGGICYAIGKDKTEYPFLWGLLGIIGVIIVYVLSNKSMSTKEQMFNREIKRNIEINKYKRLEDLYDLKARNIISEEEYEIEKNKILKG